MSRTYRRLGGDQHWKRWSLRNGHWKCEGLNDERARRKLAALWHADGNHWTMSSTPSWWTRWFMTKPQRAEVRRLTHQVLRLGRGELEDAPIFPHPKRPHVYYW